jgi:hypothetical protein
MLSLINILRVIGFPLDNYKIHLATGDNPPPFEAFLEGQFKEWQEEQHAKNFECDYILSLINIENERWLFAGMYQVLGVSRGTKIPYLYRTRLLPDRADLIGRVIVRYKRPFRASYIWGHKYGEYLEIAEIRPIRVSIEEFPGYNDVIVSHRELRMIISQQEPSWRSALSNVKGVYLVSDTATGKMYVGSATGEGGLWQRWASYADTGHGGNIELERLIEANGPEYATNFQYAVLEIADSHSTEEFIRGRESHWKDVLLSRRFGYNSN